MGETPPAEDELGGGTPMPEPGSVTREEWLSWHWHRPEPPPPLPPVIREITMEEATQVWGECMTEAGVPVTVYPDGTISWEIAPGQAESVDAVEWTCKAQYPWSAKFYQPWNDEQLRVLYEFQTGAASECAAALGYPPPPPPSLEKFVADYRNGIAPRWFPLDGVPHQQIDLYQSVSDRCPVQPEDLYDLATVSGE